MKKLFIILLVMVGLVGSVSAKSSKATKKTENSTPEIKFLKLEWFNPSDCGWEDSWYWQLETVYEDIDSNSVPVSAKMKVFETVEVPKNHYYLFKEQTTNEWYLAETQFSDEYNTITITWKRVKVVPRAK